MRVGESPGRELLTHQTGSKRLTHWTSETVYWSEIAGPPPTSNLTGALTGHCVVRRRRNCKERNGTGGRHVRSQLAFHIIDVKLSEASRCLHGAQGKARDQLCGVHQCSDTVLTGDTWFHYESGCIPSTRTNDFLVGEKTIDLQYRNSETVYWSEIAGLPHNTIIIFLFITRLLDYIRNVYTKKKL